MLRISWLCLVACGGGTAAVDSTSTDAAPCDLGKPWGAPSRITSIDTAESETSIWLSEDEQIAYVTAARASSPVTANQIYVTMRQGTGDSFAPLALLSPV